MTVFDLAALPPVITVPGIGRWLGSTTPEPDDAVESYEAYLIRISEQASHA